MGGKWKELVVDLVVWTVMAVFIAAVVIIVFGLVRFD
jgi:hypothetical protein